MFSRRDASVVLSNSSFVKCFPSHHTYLIRPQDLQAEFPNMLEASPETLVFEPTDIFDFDFGLQPQPQLTRQDQDASPTSSAPAVSTNNDVSNSTATLLMEREVISRPTAPRIPTPPPDFEPDENWEDEMAVMEMEREFAELQDEPTGRDDGNDEQTQSRISGKGKDKETTGYEFLSNGIFDFDVPVASCRFC